MQATDDACSVAENFWQRSDTSAGIEHVHDRVFGIDILPGMARQN
jgi:hypothetical protein